MFSEISNQCLPLPCYQEGYERCVDGQGSYTCVCKPGWRGQRCDQGERVFLHRLSDLSLSIYFLAFTDFIFSQILMSVKTQNSMRAATKFVTTSPGASCAAVRRASTHTTTSTASVSITAQVTGHRSQISHALSSRGVKCAGLFASRLPDEFELFQEFWDFPVKEKHDSLPAVRSVFRRKPHRRALNVAESTERVLKVHYVTVFLKS